MIRIRRRYKHSRLNLIVLLLRLRALRVYDNNQDADSAAGKIQRPNLVLDLEEGRILNRDDLRNTLEWTKPIVAGTSKLTSP